jgi:hypothetical protein
MFNLYPLVICYIAIENGPVEIVSFPSNKKMVDLSSSFCKRLPAGKPPFSHGFPMVIFKDFPALS